MQTYLYCRGRPKDRTLIKLLVRDFHFASTHASHTVLARFSYSGAVESAAMTSLAEDMFRTLDFLHTVMICIANGTYLIKYFGNVPASERITWWVSQEPAYRQCN